MEKIYNFWKRDNFYVNCYILPFATKKKPSSKTASVYNSYFTKNFVNTDKKFRSVQLLSLIDNISKNKGYIGSKKDKTFLISLDLDINTEYMFKNILKCFESYKNIENEDLENPVAKFFQLFYPTFWYETNSSKENNRKLRLVYVLDNKINKKQLYFIVDKFNYIVKSVFSTQIDCASKNIKQIFFGTRNTVYSNKIVRIFNFKGLVNAINWFCFKYGIRTSDIKNTVLLNNDISISMNEMINSNDYGEALWLYVALYHFKWEKYLNCKQKWKDKFLATMLKQPYFKPKRNTKGYMLYEVLQDKYFNSKILKFD